MTTVDVIGIGANGSASLSADAVARLNRAELVFGGARHLELARIDATRARPWPSPLSDAYTAITAHEGPVAVLATGDPNWFGIAASLRRSLPEVELRLWPTVSCFQLAAAALKWPLQSVTCCSLHGRDESELVAHLLRGPQLLALTSDGEAPARLASRLLKHGIDARAWVLEELGAADEAVHEISLEDLADAGPFASLNVLAIERKSNLLQSIALDDDTYGHDGQLTKLELRAIAVARLGNAPSLLDIGAGAGSIAIEWLRANPHGEAIALERDPTRATRMRENAEQLGVPHLQILEGTAPENLPDRTFERIFIGGGVADPATLSAAMERLTVPGRLLAHAVTLSAGQTVVAMHAQCGGRLRRIAVERAEPAGEQIVWRPKMPVVQWEWDRI